MKSHPLAAIDAQARVIPCARNRQIDSAGEARGDWYRVMSGLVRRCAFFSDGRRQIVSFLFPGDLFGFAHPDDSGLFSAEAVVRGTVLARYPWRAVEQMMASDPAAGAEIRAMAFQWMRQTEARLLNLGRMTAAERVGAFLLELSQRAGAIPPAEFALQMSRYDIADYLALSVETVSRTLTLLQQRGAIALHSGHQVRIADRDALFVQV